MKIRKTAPQLDRIATALAAAAILLAATQAAVAKNGGNSGDHGGMRSHDSSRSSGNRRM